MQQGGRKRPARKKTETEERSLSQVVSSPDLATVAPLPDDTERRIALCATCERRDECTIPVPPGGIWHCADFL